MRSNVKTTILVSLLGFSLALNLSQAIGWPPQPDPGAGRATAAADSQDLCLVDRMELDGGQREKLLELRSVMQAKRTCYWERCAEIKERLADAICAPSSRGDLLDPLLEDYLNNQAEMQRVVAGHLLEVHALLDERQRETFRTLLRTEIFRGIRSLPTEMVEER